MTKQTKSLEQIKKDLSKIEDKLFCIKKELDSALSQKKYTVKQAALFFKCTERTIFRWISKGKIKAVMEYGKLMINKNEINKTCHL